MTKIKNTKKGMAKKTLSMSLVVAMLATSNVPVWAAEFSDGTDAAVTSEVTAPAAEDTTADVAEFSDNTAEAPVVEDTTDADAATIDTAADVNLENYTVEDLKIKSTTGNWKWGEQVSVEGTIKKDGVNVPGLQYTWLADDREATEDTESATGYNYSGNLSDITYTPSIDDFQKTLSLRIYKLGANGSVIFSKTITGKTVEAKDISDKFAADLTYGKTAYPTEVTFNGEEQKPTPSNKYNVTVDSVNGTTATITSNDIDWHYETADGDLTNVTDNDVLVYGTLIGTTDRTSAAYGYTAKTKSATYQIKPFDVASKKNLAVSLTKTAVEYTGASKLQFGKNDIKLEVKVGDKNIDITAALKDKLTANTVSGSGAVGERAASVEGLTDQFATTDEAKKILKNFNFTGVSSAYKTTTTNKYTVSKRDLSTCTGVITKEYSLDTFKGKDPSKVSLDLATIQLTGADGQTFTLDKIASDVVVQINNVVFEAAENETVGTVDNAVTISYRNNSSKVTGTITLPITLVSKSLNNVEANVYTKVSGTTFKGTLGTTKNDSSMPTVPYIGKAYDLQDTSSTLKNDIYNIGFIDAGNNNEPLKVGEYTISYNDNVNAGIVEVTLTGKGSYAGSVKKFYFKITKDDVTAKEFKVADSVTINPANNNDPSLYKDALKAKFETALADGTKAVLEDGKDYTVKYYYGKKGATSVAQLKSKAQKAGTNNVGDYVYAVVTLADDCNYTTSDTFIAGSAVINKKSISDVTVSVEKDSYTFTGKEIVPNITVKDGSSTLEKGVDYTLKFKDNINAGTATVSVIPTAKSDYDVSSVATATFKIEAANAEDVKVELSTKANGTVTDKFAYTGKQVKPVVVGVKLNGVDVKDFFDITYPTYGENINAGKDMGSITITPKTSPANFTGSKTQLFTIVGKELTGGLKIYNADKTLIGVRKDQALQTGSAAYPKLYSFRYDGTAQTFGSEVFTADSKFSVTKDTDYEIKYINNVDAGVGFVAVVAKGNYEGHRDTDFGESAGEYWLNDAGIYSVEDGVLYQTVGAKKTAIQKNIVDIIGFNIEPAYFTAKNISVTNGTYAGGIPVKPQVTVSVNGAVLTEGTDYTLTLTAIDSVATPDKFVNVTAGKPYYVTVNAKGGYKFDTVNGTNTFVWGIDKKDLKDCTVVVDKNLKATVTNGNVIEEKENFAVKDNGDGTATVSVVDGGKNYTGSVNVEIGGRKVGAPMISNVKVVGNKATVILSDEVDGASGYDYVISTDKDCIKNKNYAAVNKNQAKTSTAFKYVDQGTYYAYCHAWTRDANGKKVFGEWSNGFQFSVTAITPDAPVIRSVKVSGSTVKVTYELSANATGYDVVLGTSSKKDNGELRPYNYGAHKVLNLKESTVTATFKNVPAGTWTVGMHAFNRTSIDGKKVFSPWSNLMPAEVE